MKRVYVILLEVSQKKYWHGSQTPKTVIQDIKDFYVRTKNAYSATVFHHRFLREKQEFFNQCLWQNNYHRWNNENPCCGIKSTQKTRYGCDQCHVTIVAVSFWMVLSTNHSVKDRKRCHCWLWNRKARPNGLVLNNQSRMLLWTQRLEITSP